MNEITTASSRVPAGVPSGGQFAAAVKSESEVDLAKPSQRVAPHPADDNFEAEGIESLLADLRDKTALSDAHHHSEEDLAEARDRITRLEARLEQLRPGTPEARFGAARESFFVANKASVRAAVDYLRDVIQREYPDATYLAVEESDQPGGTWWPGAVYDVDGEEIGDMDDDDDVCDAVGWLPESTSNWEADVEAEPADLPVNLRNSRFTHVRVR